jgi:hypothetical protein
MSDYLFLTNVGDEIVSSVHLSKFVPNRESQSRVDIDYKVGIYTQKFENFFWEKLGEAEFGRNNNIILNSNDYDLDVGQLAVVVPVDIDVDLNDEYTILPEPLSRKVDLSPVNERAAIFFSKDNAYSSYQGEFPHQMSKIKGTFLAFDSLMKGNNANIKTKVVFINIHSNKLDEKQVFSLNMANIDTKKTVYSQKYVHNSAGIIDTKVIDNTEACFYSKGTLGIPIFISYDDFGYLSVEHTHPPAELFWSNKFKGQQILKNNWLSQLS